MDDNTNGLSSHFFQPVSNRFKDFGIRFIGVIETWDVHKNDFDL